MQSAFELQGRVFGESQGLRATVRFRMFLYSELSGKAMMAKPEMPLFTSNDRSVCSGTYKVSLFHFTNSSVLTPSFKQIFSTLRMSVTPINLLLSDLFYCYLKEIVPYKMQPI